MHDWFLQDGMSKGINAMMAIARLTIVALSLFLVPCAWAQLKDENLVQNMPKGFKIGFQTSHNGMNMQEWVPEGETVENWSEMITTQIFLGKSGIEPATFLNGIGQQWLQTCQGSTPNPIHTGKANGYVVSMLLMTCPLNPKTGKPETTLFRVIKGTDSLYSVQRSVKSGPSQEKIAQIAQYLGTINVCDTRSAEHPCPDLKSQGFEKYQPH